jgi:hypothetical protein
MHAFEAPTRTLKLVYLQFGSSSNSIMTQTNLQNMNNTTAELQDLVGYPEWRLIDKGTELPPLEAWAPPPGRNKVSAEDLYELFHDECIVFIGDSLQRRAADTLHALIEHRGNTSQIDEYVYYWNRNDRNHNRMIGNGPPSSNNDKQYKKHCVPGTIDNLWLPTLNSFKRFKYEKNYTVLIAGNGPWDLKSNGSPNDWAKMVNASIHHLYNSVPNTVLIYWKTSPWGWPYGFTLLEPNQTSGKEGNNYLMYYANQVARETIDSINASNLTFLDWSKEILPYSFSERIPTNMMAENNDHSSWHVGPKGRALLLQMLASEIIQQKQHGGVKPFDIKESKYYKDESSTNYFGLQDKHLQAFVGFYVVAMVMIYRRKALRERRNRKLYNGQSITIQANTDCVNGSGRVSHDQSQSI